MNELKNLIPQAPPQTILSGHSSLSRLESLLRADNFVVTTELAPPDSANANDVYERARIFDGYVDAINATDGSGAHCHMSSVAVCSLLTRIGYSPIMQISCRDRNRIAIQGDVLGAAAMGVSNMMCLSGDGVQAGDHPGAKPVFDLDCMSALETLKTMRDNSKFQSGRSLTTAPNIFLGAAANPFVPDKDFRVLRLAKKIAAGAQFIQTQYCFDISMLKEYMKGVCDQGLDKQVYIIVGTGPLASARSAEFIRNNVPGVHIPDSIIKRMAGAEKQKEEGKKICVEMIQQLREIAGVSGVHVMAYRMEESVAEIIDNSKVLAGRLPWYPGLV
jgi:methylenetetrahydrofolate reductase (NADPH)